MSGRVVIMTEEESMKEFLARVLPKAFPNREENVDWLLIAHNGKTDLEASIPRKIRGWNEPGVRFMITRDSDGADCRLLKKNLEQLVPSARDVMFRIRIVCQELESWLMGDPGAVSAAYARAARHQSFRVWTKRDPDTLTNAADLLGQLTGTGAKVRRAVSIAEHMDVSRNRSRSFKVFIGGLAKMLG